MPPAKTWLRILVPVAVVALLVALMRTTSLGRFTEQDELIGWLLEVRTSAWAPIALLAAYLVMSLVAAPITPAVLAGGAVFGVWPGTALNFVGLLLGASATYWFGRWLGLDLIERLLGHRHRRLKRFLRRGGFWALVRLRFVPVPFPVTNLGTALAGVKYLQFAASTALALLPVSFLWSYFAASLVEATGAGRAQAVRNVAIVLVLLLVISFLPTRFRAWRRARRYRSLLTARRDRGVRSGASGM